MTARNSSAVLELDGCVQVILVQSFTDAEKSALMAAAFVLACRRPVSVHLALIPLKVWGLRYSALPAPAAEPSSQSAP